MKNVPIRSALCAFMACASGSALAQNLLSNGNLDRVHDVEIVPGFFLPKPDAWQNVGVRTIGGPYEDEMSSEPWAGPSPTPVTADGLFNAAPYNANPDWGVFFKPYTGSAVNGPATGHLYQDVPGTPGVQYTLTGWSGAEANALMGGAEFAIDFINGSGAVIGGTALNLLPTLFTPNGQPFNYKFHSLNAVAPANTVFVRARASMIDAMANPAGGGQAFVVDDFTLVPAPSAAACFLVLGTVACTRRRRVARKSCN